jgi:hypothetical protein
MAINPDYAGDRTLSTEMTLLAAEADGNSERHRMTAGGHRRGQSVDNGCPWLF